MQLLSQITILSATNFSTSATLQNEKPRNTIYIYIQWNLDPSFFKGMEKQNNEWGKTINAGNYYHCK